MVLIANACVSGFVCSDALVKHRNLMFNVLKTVQKDDVFEIKTDPSVRPVDRVHVQCCFSHGSFLVKALCVCCSFTSSECLRFNPHHKKHKLHFLIAFICSVKHNPSVLSVEVYR